MEFADDALHCKHVIIYFDKGRADRAMVVKTFMFLGFLILSPDNTLMKDIDKNPLKGLVTKIMESKNDINPEF